MTLILAEAGGSIKEIAGGERSRHQLVDMGTEELAKNLAPAIVSKRTKSIWHKNL